MVCLVVAYMLPNNYLSKTGLPQHPNYSGGGIVVFRTGSSFPVIVEMYSRHTDHCQLRANYKNHDSSK